MSGDPDRIAVPTNGRGPHPVARLEPLRGEPPTADPPRTESSSASRPIDPLIGSISPRGLAVGFGIVASLVLLALGRSRSRRGR
jgi:hypothetical protein